MDLLRLVQLEGLANRYPNQLSGGQAQRVALARALAVEPRVLLLDEPFGALDAKVRKELRRWLRHLHDTMGLTSVFVTHDQEEALDLADRVVVMNQGRIEQHGTPREVYEHPATPFVFEFLGNANRVACLVSDGIVEIDSLRLDAPTDQPAHRGNAIAYVRPHDLAIEPVGGPGGLNARIDQVSWVGPTLRVSCSLESDGTPIEAEAPRHGVTMASLAPGQRIALRPLAFKVFPGSP